MQSVTHVALDVRQACLMEAVDCFCAMIPDQVPPTCARTSGGTTTLKPSDNPSAPDQLLLLLHRRPLQVCYPVKGSDLQFEQG